MLIVNEQLDDLWTGNVPNAVQANADALKRGLVAMEIADGKLTPTVHQSDNEDEHS